MQNPPHRVVEELGLGERLVTTLVRNDPQASPDETSSERIDRPKTEARSWVQIWMREANALRSNLRVRVRPSRVKCS